jgi:gliding motility-associated protein GldE
MEESIPWIVFYPPGIGTLASVAVLAVLLFCSAFVSASEAAFFSLGPGDVDKLSKSNSRGAAAALRLLGTPDYLLATILIVNNLVNICAVIVANIIVDDLAAFNNRGVEFLIKIVLVTFLLLLCGEILPKILAQHIPLKIARGASVPLTMLKTLFRPLAFLLIRSGNRIHHSVSVKKNSLSMDELSNAIEITSDQSAEEKKILSGIVNYINTEAAEIMRPRVDMVAIDRQTDFFAVRQKVIDSGFSRIPVYEESMDNIKGILYVKDLLPYLESDRDFAWQKLIREPYFVPEHKRINDLMTEFQANKVHIAIVIDEYGSTLGLVSLEDILEEIVGEISDESDVDRSWYTELAPDTYLFEGKTHVIDLLKVVGLDDEYLDEFKGEAESVGGLMMEAKRDFLKKGDTFAFRALTLTVEGLEGRRVSQIKVQIDRNEMKKEHAAHS